MKVAMSSPYEVFVGHPKYKRPVGRPKRRQVDNITNNKISAVVHIRNRDHLGDPGIDVRIILKWIFRKWDAGVWTGSSGSG
jgi:hypothetical protein